MLQWAPSDSVRGQHQKHFPNCRIIRGLDAGNLPMSVAAREDADRQHQQQINQLNSSVGEPQDPSHEEKRRLAELFPCRNAINPHMASQARRLETFDHRWPKNRIHATADQISKAGLFFLDKGLQREFLRKMLKVDNKGLENISKKVPDLSPVAKHSIARDFTASQLRDQLKQKCGGSLREAFYQAAERVRGDDWKEFVRRALDLDEDEIKSYDTYSSNAKYDMLQAWWEKQKKKTGKEITTDEFIDIVVEFLANKGSETSIVVQNFNGKIKTEVFNGVVNGRDPPLQAPA